jgi:hypothetical protein
MSIGGGQGRIDDSQDEAAQLKAKVDALAMALRRVGESLGDWRYAH